MPENDILKASELVDGRALKEYADKHDYENGKHDMVSYVEVAARQKFELLLKLAGTSSTISDSATPTLLQRLKKLEEDVQVLEKRDHKLGMMNIDRVAEAKPRSDHRQEE